MIFHTRQQDATYAQAHARPFTIHPIYDNISLGLDSSIKLLLKVEIMTFFLETNI